MSEHTQPERSSGPCYCLCAVNHPDERGICAATQDRIMRISGGKLDRPVKVAMCTPCAEAALIGPRGVKALR